MSAYYNENDQYAAVWLRELIKQRLIADGEVDERSICDVRADDLAGFTQCHFFAGIGGWSCALRLAGWPDSEPVWTGSCPCQPFSSVGKGLGFNDERHLWPAWFNLIEKCRPSILLGEQVASKTALAWLDVVFDNLESAQYACAAADLCAAGVAADQIRQRLWWMAHIDGARCANAQGWAGQTTETGRAIAAAFIEVSGVSRRIPSPGFRPVVDGVHGRPPIVRGYGNAIVPQVAAEFIKAAVEAINAPRRF